MKTQMFWDVGFVAIPTQVIPPALTGQEKHGFSMCIIPVSPSCKQQKEMLGITKFICYLAGIPHDLP